MAESKKVYAEINFKFTDKQEAKATVKIKFEDGSEFKGDGIQSFEKAKELLEDMIDHPIYEPPTDNTGTTP